MKKEPRGATDEMRSEYDFGAMKGGVRGKYAQRYQAGTNLVLLEPDVARAFPTDAAVNEALRAAVRMASLVSKAKRPPHSESRPRRLRAAGAKRRAPRGDAQ